MPCYAFEGVRPVIHPTAYVHPDATLIGDVIVGAGAYIAPRASLRGDYGRLIVETGANVQDGCVMHGYAGVDSVVGEGSSIGHGAILHGCRIGPGSLVGMHAVVMDDAAIGAESIVAAMSFVPAGFAGAPRQLLKGIPAKPARAVRDEELHWNRLNAREYRDLAQRCRAALEPCEALAEPPPGRAYLSGTTAVQPLHQMRRSATG
jgi:carnitine operon protein CaiE